MHIFCSGGAAPQAGAFYRAAFPFFIFLAQAAAVAVAGTSKLLTTVSSTMLLILTFFVQWTVLVSCSGVCVDSALAPFYLTVCRVVVFCFNPAFRPTPAP